MDGRLNNTLMTTYSYQYEPGWHHIYLLDAVQYQIFF